MGLFYLKGVGVPKNELEALQWFEKAAAAGDQEAKEILKAFDEKMR